MALKEDLEADVRGIFDAQWSTRKGTVVPEADDIALGNEAVTFEEAAVLYADLAESTALVDGKAEWFAAEVYKTFLHCSAKIIRNMDGEITAFDGDRIMAVFLGDSKRSNAMKSGLKINYAVKNVINPAIKKKYPNETYAVSHAVGIDLSKLFVARTGIRGSNDLVWVGRAANYAAKLATIRVSGYSTWITAAVHDSALESARMGGDPKRSMWEKQTWTKLPGIDIYRSNWWWKV